MVYKLNKLAVVHDESIQLAFQHVSQLDFGGQFAASVHEHITTEKQHFLDEVRPESNSESESMTAVTFYDNSSVSLDNASKLSWASSDGKKSRLESSKRPVGVEEHVQVATKRARQIDGNCLPPHFACQRFFTSNTVHDEFISRKDAAILEGAKDSNGGNFSVSWFTPSASEKAAQLELPAQPSSSFPGYYEDHSRSVRRCNQVEETHSSVFNCIPRKLVALGPDHQADIPVWRSKSFRKSHGGDCPDTPADNDDSDKWVGRCVMPMHDPDSLCLEVPVGCCKADCCCLDEGSIRCVRQHVREARERLRISLGHERFRDLGFCGMGEDIALGWSEEEEHLFHEVVMSNPASLGKNFWDELPRAFPSRSSIEVVSYYFNVFMIQKRAEQNRSHPLYVDSDDDEWQQSDEGELGTTEDDSGVESPAYAADAAAPRNNSCRGDGEVNIHEDEGDDCDDEDDLSDGLHGHDKLTVALTAHDMEVSLCDSAGEDQDVHDDSCTSYEGHLNGADPSVGHADDVFEYLRDNITDSDHGNHHAEYRNDGMSSMTGHGFVVGHCDPKPWEVGSVGYIRGFEVGHCDLRPWETGSIGYIQGFDKDLDFLPTCSVIEEVFGSESWEKNREGHGVG